MDVLRSGVSGERLAAELLLSEDGSEVEDDEIQRPPGSSWSWNVGRQIPKIERCYRQEQRCSNTTELAEVSSNPKRPKLTHKSAIPLHYAATNGHMEPLQLLLEAADLNAQDSRPDGCAALMLAAQLSCKHQCCTPLRP